MNRLYYLIIPIFFAIVTTLPSKAADEKAQKFPFDGIYAVEISPAFPDFDVRYFWCVSSDTIQCISQFKKGGWQNFGDGKIKYSYDAKTGIITLPENFLGPNTKYHLKNEGPIIIFVDTTDKETTFIAQANRFRVEKAYLKEQADESKKAGK